MAKKKRAWLTGCAIGCGAILLIALGLGGAGVLWVNNTVQGFQDAVETRTDLEERFGGPGEFTPAADGSIPAHRLEAFLAVREALAPARQSIAEIFEKMPLSEQEARELDEKPFLEKMGAVFNIGASVMSMGIDLGNFFRDRNGALLDSEMGLGEYTYIYALSYYAFLERSPADGPGENEGDFMGDGVLQRVHGNLNSMLENQRASLPEEGSDQLRADLTAELAAMAEDPDRFPWQDELPEVIRRSLEPYRERLEASYHPITNPFELARNRKRGRMSFTAD